MIFVIRIDCTVLGNVCVSNVCWGRLPVARARACRGDLPVSNASRRVVSPALESHVARRRRCVSCGRRPIKDEHWPTLVSLARNKSASTVLSAFTVPTLQTVDGSDSRLLLTHGLSYPCYKQTRRVPMNPFHSTFKPTDNFFYPLTFTSKKKLNNPASRSGNF